MRWLYFSIHFVICFLLFGLQFVVYRYGVSFYETPKILAAQVGIITLGVLLLFRFFLEKPLAPSKMYLILGGSLFLLLLVQYFLLDGRELFLWGNVFRFQGAFLLVLLLAFGLMGTVVVVNRFYGYLALVALIVSGFVALYFPRNGVGRMAGLLGEPNMLAETYVFLWPWLLIMQFKTIRIKMLVSGLGMLLAFCLIYLTGSRSGLLAIGLQSLILVSYWVKKRVVGVAVVISLVIMLTASVLPFLEKDRIWENRGEIWYTALQAGMESPIIGHGFGQVELALANTAWRIENTLRYQYVDSSHNIFMDWWVQGGLWGISILLAFLGLALWRLIRIADILNVLLLTGMLGVLFFNPGSMIALVHLWWVIGRGVSSQVVQLDPYATIT